MPDSSICAQAVHPDPANCRPGTGTQVSSIYRARTHPDPGDEPRTNDQEGLTASGDQASDLDFLVAGVGFEPATSGLWALRRTSPRSRDVSGRPLELGKRFSGHPAWRSSS